MARFTALLDACVLVPVAPVDTILRMAERGAFRPVWSQRIIDEAQSALMRIHPTLAPSRIESRFSSMNEAFDDALISGWEPLVVGLELPDPNDRHVLAAAIAGRADVIVTHNLKDFPASVLEPFGIQAVSLDDFLLDQFDLSPRGCVQVLEDQAAAKRNPPVDVVQLIEQLGKQGAPQFASTILREYMNTVDEIP